MTLRVERRMLRPPSLVSKMYKDSGVVTMICGGRRRIAWRTDAGVSPVRTTVRMSMSTPESAFNSSLMAANGCSRLR